MSKYIGIRKEDKVSYGNIGDIWVKNVNGVYVCEGKRSVLSEAQIQQSLANGHIKKLEE